MIHEKKDTSFETNVNVHKIASIPRLWGWIEFKKYSILRYIIYVSFVLFCLSEVVRYLHDFHVVWYENNVDAERKFEPLCYGKENLIKFLFFNLILKILFKNIENCVFGMKAKEWVLCCGIRELGLQKMWKTVDSPVCMILENWALKEINRKWDLSLRAYLLIWVFQDNKQTVGFLLKLLLRRFGLGLNN